MVADQTQRLDEAESAVHGTARCRPHRSPSPRRSSPAGPLARRRRAGLGFGHALFEATHGTAPKYAGQDKVNPGSVVLSGEMMLRYMGWNEAADRFVAGIERTIQGKIVTYDFARLMEGATEVKCSAFGTAIIDAMARL